VRDRISGVPAFLRLCKPGKYRSDSRSEYPLRVRVQLNSLYVLLVHKSPILNRTPRSSHTHLSSDIAHDMNYDLLRAWDGMGIPSHISGVTSRSTTY
jgi:hypothetical protein